MHRRTPLTTAQAAVLLVVFSCLLNHGEVFFLAVFVAPHSVLAEVIRQVIRSHAVFVYER